MLMRPTPGCCIPPHRLWSSLGLTAHWLSSCDVIVRLPALSVFRVVWTILDHLYAYTSVKQFPVSTKHPAEAFVGLISFYRAVSGDLVPFLYKLSSHWPIRMPCVWCPFVSLSVLIIFYANVFDKTYFWIFYTLCNCKCNYFLISSFQLVDSIWVFVCLNPVS